MEETNGQQVGGKKVKSDSRLVPEPVPSTWQEAGSKNLFFATQLTSPYCWDKASMASLHVARLCWSLGTRAPAIIVLFRGAHKAQSIGARDPAGAALASRRTSQSCSDSLT